MTTSTSNDFNDNAEQKPQKTRTNPFTSIVEHLKRRNWILRRNDISKEIELNGDVQSEQALNSIFIVLNTAGCEANIKDWNVFINSHHIPSFNPLVDFLEGLEEDNKCWGTIDRLARCLILDPTQGMTYEVCRKFITRWLVGVVASIYGDWYNSIFLVLCGPKGCGKTEFFRRLLPLPLIRFFAESRLSGGKDDEMLAAKCLVLLVDEMDSINRRDAADIRRFLSSNTFSYRAPYAKAPITTKRLASLCGSSNEAQIIVDAQNNRRIVPICITGVDHELYNSIDKNELFREALFLLKNGEDWHLNKSEIQLLDQYTGINAVVDLEQEMLEKYFLKDGDSFITSSEIAIELQQRTSLRISSTKVGKALAAAGFQRLSKKVNGSARYGWQARPTGYSGS